MRVLSKFFSALILFLISFQVFAVQLIPTSLSIQGEGKGSTGRFEIVNNTREPIAIEVNVAKRIVDKYGKEKHPLVNEMFSVHPSNLIVKAGEKKSFRVSLKKGRKIKIEEAYRVIVEQLPLDIDQTKVKKKGNIRILMKFLAALYISPKKADPKISLKRYSAKKDKMFVELKNYGNTHKILDNFAITIKGKKKIKLSSEKLKMMKGENILANTSRIFKLPIPKEIRSSKYNVSFSIE